MREITKKAFDNIVDVMTGSDGGIKFLYLKYLMDAMDKKDQEGDLSAQKLVKIMIDFSKLIDVAETVYDGEKNE